MYTEQHILITLITLGREILKYFGSAYLNINSSELDEQNYTYR